VKTYSTDIITALSSACGILTKEIRLTGGPRMQHRLRMITASLFILFALSAVILNTQIGFAVLVNGETVGTAQSKAEATHIIENVEQQASQILGFDYSMADKVTVTAELAPEKSDSSELEKVMLGSIDGIVQRYAIVVDGTIIGSSENAAELINLLQSILDEYGTPDTISLSFVQDVSVDQLFLRDDTTQDLSLIRSQLDPKNDDASFCLSVERVETRSVSEAISYDTEYYDDSTIYTGTTRVDTAGADGERVTTVRSTSINGKEISSQAINTFIKSEPVAEVVACGTAELPPTASRGCFIWPTDGIITSYFGARNAGIGSTNHKGIDIGGVTGQDILAADGGEVIYAGWNDSGYGYLVKLQHDDGSVTYYAHCSSVLVSEGERVAQGQVIALMGSTGISSGPHLHFEIRPGGDSADNSVDPLTLLP